VQVEAPKKKLIKKIIKTWLAPMALALAEVEVVID
jgi:hypothetical protein